ncbi:MAG: pyridoxine 5'-phosphate synthase [Deltaproteobacteria bacterium]|nr:pyridoxine 5'-phosphate synthase [Deltaproteobacteria bacterium]
MPALGVNVDHVATVRQARRAPVPDPVAAAVLAELAGADGITVHLREDRRHIQDRDVEVLRRTVKTRLNLEMAATDEMVRIALELRPDQVTLVPEKRAELTTEGGLDVVRERAATAAAIRALHEGGVPVFLFVDPDPAQLDASRELGASGVEIHTGTYCDAREPTLVVRELGRVRDATSHALGLGLEVHAGHGLDYQNVGPVAAIPGVAELNIGHSIVARAVLVGLERAVAEMAGRIRAAVL